MVGGLIMGHGDDRAWSSRPTLAAVQAVVVLVKDDELAGGGDAPATPPARSAAELAAAGVRIEVDARVATSFGRRATEWELKGVPVRIEVGPRDLAEGEVTLVRRDTGEKASRPRSARRSHRHRLLLLVQSRPTSWPRPSSAATPAPPRSRRSTRPLEAAATGWARLPWDVVRGEGESPLARRRRHRPLPAARRRHRARRRRRARPGRLRRPELLTVTTSVASSVLEQAGWQGGTGSGSTSARRYTAAAIRRETRAPRSSTSAARGAAIPSVLLLRADGELLTGDTARAERSSEPDRVAAEFKRRVGDPVPCSSAARRSPPRRSSPACCGGSSTPSAEREGGPPEGIAVTHPANWGPYKLDLLSNAIRTAGVGRVTLPVRAGGRRPPLRHPVAGARRRHRRRLRPRRRHLRRLRAPQGRRRRASTLLGQPEGIERLGGIDLDEAVFGHVQRAVPDLFDSPRCRRPGDPGRPRPPPRRVHGSQGAAVERRRRHHPVLLPARPAARCGSRAPSSRASSGPSLGRHHRLRRAVARHRRRHRRPTSTPCCSSAGLPGAARGQLVAQGLGRPVAVDADPKLVVAQGAALAAESAFVATAATPEAVVPIVPVAPDPAPEPEPVGAAPAWPVAALPEPEPEGAVAAGRGGRSKVPFVIAAIVVFVALIGGFLLLGGDDGGGDGDDLAAGDTTTTAAAEETTTTVTETLEGGAEFAGVDPDLPEFADIVEVFVDEDGRFEIQFGTNFDIADADLAGPRNHVHLFYDNVSRDAAGGNGTPEPCDCWFAFGGPAPASTDLFTLDTAAGHSEICVLVATPTHDIADVDGDGRPDPGSGDCIDISPLLDGADSVEETLGPPSRSARSSWPRPPCDRPSPASSRSRLPPSAQVRGAAGCPKVTIWYGARPWRGCRTHAIVCPALCRSVVQRSVQGPTGPSFEWRRKRCRRSPNGWPTPSRPCSPTSVSCCTTSSTPAPASGSSSTRPTPPPAASTSTR